MITAVAGSRIAALKIKNRTALEAGTTSSAIRCPDRASLAEVTIRMLPGVIVEMTYGHLGRSGLMVSRIGLGTMNFGYTVDESSSFAVMDAAIDAGITFFDTADVYGGPQSADMEKGYGISEQTVGRWLQRSGRRDDIVLATKVYQPMGLGPNDRRLSAYHIRRACEASLRRLQTDHIDLYQMHHVDRATPWEEIWQAMEQLVREGKISYVGSSNFAAWDVALAQCAASARHFLGLTSEQSLYNLAVRAVELELIPALRNLGIGLIPYSPLHAGLLAGLLGTANEGRLLDDSMRQRIEAHHDQLEAFEGLCRELGAEPAQVALAWVLRNPVVSTTIVGALSIEELRTDLGALSVQLDDAAVERLDKIWPGPGEAPQAYAW
jgi:aryl-alcohol dehydrogenase-like predicted oxidoreductase